MALLFEPLSQKAMNLRNRIVMSPMCMYSAGADSVPTDWHFVHLGTRAVGGAALVITEATAVEPVGRISTEDLGLWNDEQQRKFTAIGQFVHKNGAAFGIQIAHAGRKAWSGKKAFGPETPVAPSALPWGPEWNTPTELDLHGLDRIVAAFGATAKRATEIGCDMVEIHAAHGYLLHQFLSPLSNHRTDDYGGSLENRARMLKRVFDAVKANFPAERPVWVRISGSDWVEGGWDIDQSVALAKLMKQWGVDLVDCSGGGNSPLQNIPALGPGYQVPFAARIKREAGIATGAVGLILDAQQAEQILANGDADVILLARELLRNPYFPLQAAHQMGVEVDWPVAYVRGKWHRPK